MAAEQVKHIELQDFEAYVGEKKVALVDFWAPWCGPCRAVGPVIEELAGEYDGRVNVGKVNVDEQSELAARFGVMSIPTVLLFVNGTETERLVGAMPAEEYRKVIDAHL